MTSPATMPRMWTLLALSCALTDATPADAPADARAPSTQRERPGRPDRGDQERPGAPSSADGGVEAAIHIAKPASGATVTPGGELVASGDAMVYEGRLHLCLKAGGRDDCLVFESVTASSAAPARGDWSTLLQVPSEGLEAPVVLEAFTYSARDGSQANTARVELSL